MTRRNTWAILAVAAALSLPLTACKDTQTLQENERLKAQVAELQKENGQMGNEIETVTAARDALTKENETLRAQLKARKTKHSGKKAASKKRRQAKVRSSLEGAHVIWIARTGFHNHLQKREV